MIAFAMPPCGQTTPGVGEQGVGWIWVKKSTLMTEEPRTMTVKRMLPSGMRASATQTRAKTTMTRSLIRRRTSRLNRITRGPPSCRGTARP